ncbi:MAG: PHP domain-containing protein [Clostridiales bacterium]|jgi:predicted metal-dependent phosphoesterase TrpH|nr:PHP domain-containing protein [Clostridiales bacterium]
MENLNFNTDSLIEIANGHKEFIDFAAETLVHTLYAGLCGKYLNRDAAQRDQLTACFDLYDAMFRLTLRMNRLCPIYDEGFISHIAREAAKTGCGTWAGMAERELRDTIRRGLQKCSYGNTDINRSFAIDCHVHTKEGSGCAHYTRREMVESAIAEGLNGIVITEHDKLTPQEVIDELNADYAPFRVFSGIEVRVWGDDFLVLGIQDNILEKTNWDYHKLYQFVRENGGYIALAHPMRYWHGIDTNLYSWRPDALEIYSFNMDNISWQARQRALRLANALQTNIIANSDAHAADKYRYCNVLNRQPQSDSDLAQMLKDGAYRLGRVPVLK